MTLNIAICGKYAWLFKRSVTICGFNINREEVLEYAAADLCEIEVLHASHLVVRGRKLS